MSNPVLAKVIEKVRGIAIQIELPVTDDGVLEASMISALHRGVEEFGVVKGELMAGWSVLAGKEQDSGRTFIILSRRIENNEVYSYTLSDKEHHPINVAWLDRLPVIDRYVQILEGVYNAKQEPQAI